MKTFLITTLTILTFNIFAQKNVEVVALGFYNLENLFDTIQDPEINDEDFLPDGSYHYNSIVYNEKLGNLSNVISQIGTELTPDGAAIMGVAEVENKSVLIDLVKQKKLQARNYQIVHYDSPDERGIDVALLYNPKYFKVIESDHYFVQLPERDGEPNYTRDVLWVKGSLLGEEVHILVNHWPSRGGGEAKSSPLRVLAAEVAKVKIDEILAKDKDAKIILMGDLNDDPVNKSIKKVIGAKGNLEGLQQGEFYNPWMSMYKNGIGTLAYRDAWNLFDQIVLSSGIASENTKGFRLYKAKIFNKSFLYTQEGRFKGYPKRTYSFGKYMGGYSDHLPTYVYLLREK